MTVTIVAIVVVVAFMSTGFAAAYTNYTVGDTAGWSYDINTNTSAIDYSAWAAAKNFSLGDYLVFVTTSNQTVVQTYNETTYKSCLTDDSQDDDTFIYTNGTTAFDQHVIVAVPLTIEGVNYYFSDGDDGVQCARGLAFQINVTHGEGLPPSLNQPPPPTYVPPPSPPGPAADPGVTVKTNHAGKVTGSVIVRMMVYFWPLIMFVRLN